MRVILFAVFVLLITNSTFAYTVNSLDKKPVNVDNIQSITSSNLEKLAEIEQKLFGKIYSAKSLDNRLTRIEKRIFSESFNHLSNAQRLDNIINNFQKHQNNINISKLSKLEKKIFGQEFILNNSEDRIERLEQKVFGAVQSGDLNTRIKTLEIASKNNTNNLDENDSKWSFIGGNSMQGFPTGITPSISPYYNNYYNTFNSLPVRSRMYNPAYRNYGWHHRPMYNHMYPHHGYNPRYINGNGIRNFGTGSRVTILN